MYDPENVFAKILRRQLPCKLLYEDEGVVAFADKDPRAPVHVLVIPKTPHRSFDDFVVDAPPAEVAAFFQSVQKVAHLLGLDQGGYRLVMNHGANAHQEVHHFHVHLLGGGSLVPLGL